MSTHHDPSDVTDEQWALIEPFIPVYLGGRPRKTDVLDAIVYLLRTGCQWRDPPVNFPPRSTVWRYFDEWRPNGTLDRIQDALRRKVRTMETPYQPRTTASVDSQSVDATYGGEHRGRDNHKNIDRRKRDIAFNYNALRLAELATAAFVDDAHAATEVFARLDGPPIGRVTAMGETVDPLGRGTEIRLARSQPPPEHAPREDRPVVGGVPQAGDDPPDAPSPPPSKVGDPEFLHPQTIATSFYLWDTHSMRRSHPVKEASS